LCRFCAKKPGCRGNDYFQSGRHVPSLHVQQATLTHVGGMPGDRSNVERRVGTELESLWGPFCVIFAQKSQGAVEMATFSPDDMFRVYASNKRHSLTSAGCLETVSTLSAKWGLSWRVSGAHFVSFLRKKARVPWKWLPSDPTTCSKSMRQTSDTHSRWWDAWRPYQH